MTKKTLARWLGLVLMACAGGSADITAAKPLDLRVSLFNDASLPASKVEQAQKVAAAVFARSGIAVEWLTCGRPNETPQEQFACGQESCPRHLQVRILSKSLNLKESTFGISYLGEGGEGFQADIFYAGVAHLEQGRINGSESVLGLAIAHELGHLLLGTDSHAVSGLMRRVWSADDLAAAAKGNLVFTEGESRRLRSRLTHRGG